MEVVTDVDQFRVDNVQNKVQLVANKQITVWAYPDLQAIHHVMNGFCHGEHFREGLMKGVEAM